MKTIGILVPENAIFQVAADAHRFFGAVNSLRCTAGKQELFRVHLLGLHKQVRCPCGSFSIHPEVLVENGMNTDLVIIPPFAGDPKTAIRQNERLLPWIVGQFRGGASLACLGTGAFLLAATGLIDGKSCSVPAACDATFRLLYPAVSVIEERMISRDYRLYAHGLSNVNGFLGYLIDNLCPREMTSDVTAQILADTGSDCLLLQGKRFCPDDVIRQAQEYIENNARYNISVGDLSRKFSLVRRTFERRFKASTRNTVRQYIQRVKIEAAKRSFETGRKKIAEVMYDVGYSDIKAFRCLFKKLTGMSPARYRSLHNR